MKLTMSEQTELQRQANARNGRSDSARFARLILLLVEGGTWAEIRTKLDCADSFISRWSKRLETERLAGLFARHAGRERYKAILETKPGHGVLPRTDRIVCRQFRTSGMDALQWSTSGNRAEYGVVLIIGYELRW